jgi:hypothetical protein
MDKEPIVYNDPTIVVTIGQYDYAPENLSVSIQCGGHERTIPIELEKVSQWPDGYMRAQVQLQLKGATIQSG